MVSQAKKFLLYASRLCDVLDYNISRLLATKAYFIRSCFDVDLRTILRDVYPCSVEIDIPAWKSLPEGQSVLG